MCSIRLNHWKLAAHIIPSLLVNSKKRELFIKMWQFCWQLPTIMSHTLPIAHKQLISQKSLLTYDYDELRQMIDLVAWLCRYSSLGICLRRSLLRYYFLGCANLPIAVQFGAKFKEASLSRDIGGHAWTTINGEPYYEVDADWQNFIVMMTWQPITSI